MNIITGINRNLEKGKGKREKGNGKNGWRDLLKQTFIMGILGLAVVDCAPKQQAEESSAAVRSDVTVCSPILGNAEMVMRFQAVTRYMQSNDIRSQITGIITQINCSVAGDIHTNQSLFVVQSQESAALKKSKFGNQMLTSLSDTVFAHLSGQISKLNVQVGDWVQAGDVLASCIRGNSMRIIAFIPVEQVSEIEKLKVCKVVLPDATILDGSISAKLTSADPNDQTQSYIIETKKAISMSENINLSVQFTSEQIQDGIFVPESAVIGNEEQTSFWVMKLINDSLSVKIQVEKGIRKDSLIQLIGSGLTVSDKIISDGAYGLPDSASVHAVNSINKSEKNAKPAANSKATGSRH